MKSDYKNIARENFLKSGYIMSSSRVKRIFRVGSMPSQSPLELSLAIGYALRHKEDQMTQSLICKPFNLSAIFNAFIRRRNS
jgi:hypothetical protein